MTCERRLLILLACTLPACGRSASEVSEEPLPAVAAPHVVPRAAAPAMDAPDTRIAALLAAWREVPADADDFDQQRERLVREMRALGSAAWPALAARCLELDRADAWDSSWSGLMDALRPEPRDAIVPLLRDGGSAERALALAWLCDSREWRYASCGAELARGLAAALGDAERCIRLDAANHLGDAGPTGAACFSALVPLLASEDEAIRNTAKRALVELGMFAQDAVADLAAALAKSDAAHAEVHGDSLAYIGAASADGAQALAGVLRDGDDAHRLILLRACAEWNDVPEPVVAEARALLAAGRADDAMTAAAIRLLVAARRAGESYATIAEAVQRTGEELSETSEAFGAALATDDGAAAARRALRDLPPDRAFALLYALGPQLDDWPPETLAAFRASPDELLRAFAAAADGAAGDDALAAARRHADDEEQSRRTVAATILASRPDGTAEQALAFLAVDSEAVREVGIRQIAALAEPVAGPHPEALDVIVRSCLAVWSDLDLATRVRAAQRVEGGVERLVAACAERLRSESLYDRRPAMDALRQLGAAGGPFAQAIAGIERTPSMRADQSGDIARALAYLGADAAAVAAAIDWPHVSPQEALRELRPLGDAGMREFVGHAGLLDGAWMPAAIAELSRDDALVAAIRAAASADAPDADRLQGLARLAAVLPDAECLELLIRLADGDAEIRRRVAESCVCLARARRESDRVTGLVGLLMRSADDRTRVAACSAALDLDAADARIASGLRACSRGGDASSRLVAAVALTSVPGEASDAWPVVRASLARMDDLSPDTLSGSWSGIAAVWQRIDLPPDGVEMFRAALRTAGDCNAERAILTALARYGPAAAPALPEIRRALAGDFSCTWGSHMDLPVALEAANALAAIGSAAAPALPDLRAAREESDEFEAIDRAIRAIESAQLR